MGLQKVEIITLTTNNKHNEINYGTKNLRNLHKVDTK